MDTPMIDPSDLLPGEFFSVGDDSRLFRFISMKRGACETIELKFGSLANSQEDRTAILPGTTKVRPARETVPQ